MSDPILPASGNVVPPSGQTQAPTGLTPEEVRGRAAWVKAGLDPAVFDKRMSAPEGSVRPVSGASRDQSGRFTTPAAPSTGSGDGTNLDAPTVARARDMVSALRAQGMDENRITAALKADGIDLSGAPALTQQQVEHNRDHGMDRVYSPADYAINFREALGGHLGTMTPQDVKELNAEMSGALAAMNMPPALGASLAERMLKVGAVNANLSEDALRLQDGAGKAILQRRWGADYEARMQDAAAALNMIPDAELRETIAKLGDWFITAQLAAHGRNLRNWQSTYPKGAKS